MRNATLVEKTVGKIEDGGRNEVSRETVLADGDQKTRETDFAGGMVLSPGPWAEFLASKPEERALQWAIIKEITEKIVSFKPLFRGLIQQNIDTAEMGRQIGIAVVELEDRLPGKKLTEDFWRQMESVFNANTGQSITREMLLWFAKIARAHADPITTIAEVRQFQQTLCLASGEPEFQLQGERGPQVAHAPSVPLNSFVDYFDFSRMSKLWKDVKSDGTSFINGRLNPDLVPVLRVDFEEPIRLLEEIRKELGL